MVGNSIKQIFSLILTLVLSGCAVLSLKAPPTPESQQVKALVSSSGAELKPDDKGLYPFNHTWSAGYCAPEPATSVFINPVDISRVRSETRSNSHISSEDLSALADYARRRLEGAFSEQRGNFRVVDEPPAHGRVVELSVVELSGTEVFRNVLGTALGAIVPGGGLLA